MVVVVRPGYRIDSRTIKRGSRVSTFTVSFGESSNICIIGIIFLGSYPWEDLELVLFSMTSSSSSKTDCICHLYCVFDIGGFTGLSFIDRSKPFFIWFYPPQLDYDVSMHIVEGLVVAISTSPRTSKTESGFKIYDHFDIAVSASFLGRIIRPEKGPDNPPGKGSGESA